MKITTYDNIESPKVNEIIDIEKFINTVKYGDENKILIESARTFGKGHKQYIKLKELLIPAFRFNFIFKDSVTNNNIIEPTGLIYLDVDEKNVIIPDSDYIFAKWKSLSNIGYGLLIKVDNLTLNNFREVYDSIGKLLNVVPDPRARKATQQTVLSYDENIYYNPKSLIYHHEESKKVLSPSKSKKRECIRRDETFSGISTTVRFNNIDDYFIDCPDKPYLLFKDEKVKICDPFIPLRVEEGFRNSYTFLYISQLTILNPFIGNRYLMSCAEGINRSNYPKLNDNELDKIVKSALKKREEGSLEMFYNKERRILFNPMFKILHKDKMQIVNKELGKLKSEATKDLIYDIIEDWDFKTYGKIKQKVISQIINMNISTVKRYWSQFKDYVRVLNLDESRRVKALNTEQKALYIPSNDTIGWDVIPNKTQEKKLNLDIRNDEAISISA